MKIPGHRRRFEIARACISAFVVTYGALLPTLLLAQEAVEPVTPVSLEFQRQTESAAALARRYVDDREIPGLSAAVSVAGRIVWSTGVGYADLEQRVAVWPSTRFRIGSVSKTVTAAALGLLHDAGKLDLDGPIQQYVPDFPKKQWSITTRQLAGHLAGVRHYNDDEDVTVDEAFDRRRYHTVDDGLAIFRSDPLVFQPGSTYHYSSYGWNLISAVIEGASGEPFLTYMKQHIFEPLGMRHTMADHPDMIISQRGRFYERSPEGGWRNAPYIDVSYKWAGGGLLSTSEDLVRYAAAYLTDDFLACETIAMMFRSMRTADGQETGYGIGWSVKQDEEGRQIVQHGGDIEGGRAHLVLYPGQGVAVAVLVNLTSAPSVDDLARQIAIPFLKASPGVEARHCATHALAARDCTGITGTDSATCSP